MPVRHVLMTTDLSPEALRPRAEMLEMLKPLGARRTLLHVVPAAQVATASPPGYPNVMRQEQLYEQAEKDLAEQAASFEGVEVGTAILTGEGIARGVAEYAKEHDVDMIALSTHGRTGFRRLVLGSEAEAILRHAPVPALCFHQPE